MSIFKKLLSGGLGEVIEKTGNAIDKITTSKKEKLELKNELETILGNYEARQEEQLTERLRIDVTSDNKLSKNIRPLSYLIMIIVVLACSIMDGSFKWFNVGLEYIELYKILLVTMTVFYFGSRGWEKITKLRNEKEIKK